jgi:hypothetical protein
MKIIELQKTRFARIMERCVEVEYGEKQNAKPRKQTKRITLDKNDEIEKANSNAKLTKQKKAGPKRPTALWKMDRGIGLPHSRF